MKKITTYAIALSFGLVLASAGIAHAGYNYTLSFSGDCGIVATVYAEPTLPLAPIVIGNCQGGTCSGSSSSAVPPTKITVKYKTPNGNNHGQLIDGTNVVLTTSSTKRNKAIKCGVAYPGVWFGSPTPQLDSCTLTETD